MIHINFEQIGASYIFGHAIYAILAKFGDSARKEVIEKHVFEGHENKLTHCLQNACSAL